MLAYGHLNVIRAASRSKKKKKKAQGQVWFVDDHVRFHAVLELETCYQIHCRSHSVTQYMLHLKNSSSFQTQNRLQEVGRKSVLEDGQQIYNTFRCIYDT